MSNVADCKVGDVVWWTDTANGKGVVHESVVSKVSRAFIYVGNGYAEMKFRIDTMRRADAYGHEFLILDKDSWEDKKLIGKIIKKIRYGTIDVSSLEDAKMAAKLLGIEIGE